MSDKQNKCKTCKHSVFDMLWGEWKCCERQIRIYYPEMQNNCRLYEPMEGKEKIYENQTDNHDGE